MLAMQSRRQKIIVCVCVSACVSIGIMAENGEEFVRDVRSKKGKIIELKKIREEDLLIHQKVKIRKNKGVDCCLLLCIGMIRTRSVTVHVQIQEKAQCVFKMLYGISRRD